jgi:hypothetical protein
LSDAGGSVRARAIRPAKTPENVIGTPLKHPKLLLAICASRSNPAKRLPVCHRTHCNDEVVACIEGDPEALGRPPAERSSAKMTV